MNIKILLLAISAFTLASCSSTYKNTQTPDDVYYSPARTVENDNRKDEVKRYDPEEREIRMSAYDSRWRSLNNRYNYGYNLSPYDYDYGYNSYNPYNNAYGSYSGYHGYNNYYGNSGYYYNPYYASYPIYIVTTTTKPVNRTPRKVNLSGYGQNNTTRPLSSVNTTNNKYNNSNSSNRQYNNSNSSQGKSYTPARNQQPTRTYSPTNNESNNSGRSSNSNSSSNSSGSSSGSSSSGSVERPSRGNN